MKSGSRLTSAILYSTVALCNLCLVLCAGPVHADILYSYSSTLSLDWGTDSFGLDGATSLISFRVPTGAVYVNRFDSPAVLVQDAQVTFSGARFASNNGTFSLGDVAFYPGFAGIYSEPSGYPLITLPIGGDLEIQGDSVPTESGAMVQISDLVRASDFGPTTGSGYFHNGETYYRSTDAVVTVTQSTGGAVPEASTIALLGVASLPMIIGVIRRKK